MIVPTARASSRGAARPTTGWSTRAVHARAGVGGATRGEAVTGVTEGGVASPAARPTGATTAMARPARAAVRRGPGRGTAGIGSALTTRRQQNGRPLLEDGR